MVLDLGLLFFVDLKVKLTFLAYSSQNKPMKIFFKTHFSIIALVAGFLFDLLTLKRIDQTITLVQHGIFLLIIAGILSLFFLHQQNYLTKNTLIKKHQDKFNFILHFLFGGLLSAFTIFYFKSSSIMTSFLFLSLLIGLLLINEHKSFQSMGLKIKFAMFSLCMISYFSYLVPTLIGFIGLIPLLISVVLVLAIVILMTLVLDKPEIHKDALKQQITVPCLSVLMIFLALYALKLIPPVPLSIKHIGIYHNVGKSNGKFELTYNRSWWKFWQNGDQDFSALPQDKIYCFASIFSPTQFSDQIYFHWSKKNKSRWVEQDKVAIDISGGREQGFRAYTYKSQYTSGDWRVQVKTKDGFELGRIYFEIEKLDHHELVNKIKFY